VNTPETQTSKATILLVDDTPANLHLLTDLLSTHGYRIRSLPNGARADEHTRDIPIIFISALDEVFDKVTAFSVGGVDYITKPFQELEVVARVQTHLALQDRIRSWMRLPTPSRMT
jgi:DNA-binding response OmpR family regulator